MQRFQGGAQVRLWDGRQLHYGDAPPRFTLVIKSPSLIRKLVMEHSPLSLAEAYFRGNIEIEGDFYEALSSLRRQFEELSLGWQDKAALLLDLGSVVAHDESDDAPFSLTGLKNRFSHRHTKESDEEAIAFHYDVSNDFYGLWLDEERVYSCAYFRHPEETIHQAQRNKLDHICRKLRLQAGESLLDIGCGWGALICWAARNYGVRAHGITLSRKQFDFVRERIRNENLDGRVTVELRDYRDLEGENAYDKVSSIGMFEHVGLANLAAYNATVHRVLRPGGLFLNHGITHDTEGWERNLTTEFINRYVFPDGELDLVSNVQRKMEHAGFEIHDVEGLRPHYALTLRHWAARLEANRDAAQKEVGPVNYRVWRLYLAGCALEFESGGAGIHQILASKRDRGRWPLPLTRDDLYPHRL
nr:cyclopropane-fatty-acyl-phospholipid synthase family protein [Noviherbaspirillum galbum]